MMTFSRTRGVTLVEMMITLVIIGILAGLAVPAYRMYIQNARASALSDEFTIALAFTRNEALKRSATVTMCAAADANLNSCGTNADWGNGWIIFNDPNGDGVIAAAGDRLRTHEALVGGTTITTTLARVTYAGTGFLDTTAGTFNLAAPDCTGNNGRTVTISSTGYTRSADAAC